MRIELYNYEVEIDDNILTEVDIYNKYVELSKDTVKQFVQFYNAASGIGEVISHGKKIVYNKYKEIVKYTISLCANNGVFGLTEDDIFKYHGDFAIDNEIHKIADKSDNIKLQQRREESYRENRKQHRARFVGGGFGIEGAVKGMAMAGTANMVTGMFHSVANAFGNAGSVIKRNARLSQLYHDGTCGEICKAIRRDCIMFYYVMEDILSDYGFRSYDIPKRIEKADAIYQQLEDGILPRNSYAQAIATMIAAFPGDLEYYALACNLLGDSNGMLRTLVEKFGLDVEEYSVIEASAEWRRLIFGDFIDYIKEDKEYKFFYLKRICYSKWGRGIIEELQYGPIDAVSQIVLGIIDEFRLEKQYKEIELYTFEEGKNAYLLALFESRNIKLEYKEVPVFAINISDQIMKGAKTSEHILLTSKKIYYVSKNGKNNSCIDVQEIRSIDFLGDEYGVQINNRWFAPKTYLMDENELEIRGVLCSIIAIIQCLQSVGHPVRSAAIIESDSLDKDYEPENDICIYFREPIYDLFDNGGTIQSAVELMNTDGYNLDISRNIEPVDKDEIELATHSNYKLRALLTNKRLYITTVDVKGNSSFVYNLNEITSAFYEWKYMSEAFFINGKEYSAISTDKKEEAKFFIGVVYWVRKYIHDEKQEKDIEQIIDNKFTTLDVNEFKNRYSCYVEMIESGNVDRLWEYVKKGDSIAEYVIEQIYEEKLPLKSKMSFEEHDILDKICYEIEENTEKDSPISKYVKSMLYVRLNLRNENVQGGVESEIDNIESLARESNCVSAKAYAGFALTSSRALNEREGMKLLNSAAYKMHPLAMAWYGSYLMSGEHRVKVDKDTARLMLEAAAFAGQNYAIKLCQEYNLPYDEFCVVDSELSEMCFEKHDNRWILDYFPKVIKFKYDHYFLVYNKGIIYNRGDFLIDDNRLPILMEAFGIPRDEKLYFAISFQLTGHFKKNGVGLAIGKRGVYIRKSKKDYVFYLWPEFVQRKIIRDNSLMIDNMNFYTSIDWLCVEFLTDLQKLVYNNVNEEKRNKILSKKYTEDKEIFYNESEKNNANIEKFSVDNQSDISDRQKKEEFYKQEVGRKVKFTTVVLKQSKKELSICPSCGKENRLVAKFCKFCGNTMAEETVILCNKCGSKIKLGKKFCSACGTKVENKIKEGSRDE